MKNRTVFVACDTSNLKEVKNIISKTKTNKLIKSFGVVVFVCAIGIIFFTFKENFYQNNTTQSVQVEKDKPKKIEKQKKEVKKKIEKKQKKKEEQKKEEQL